MTEKTIHEGRNVKRIRELFGIKQDALAADLGLSQQAISSMEQKETIDPKILEDVAKALKVPVDAIRNFDADAAISNTQNNYDGAVIHAGPTINYQCSINPFDKMIELYERVIREKNEKIALLEKILEKRQA